MYSSGFQLRTLTPTFIPKIGTVSNICGHFGCYNSRCHSVLSECQNQEGYSTASNAHEGPHTTNTIVFKMSVGDFPSGPAVDFTFQCRWVGSIPGWGAKLSYVSQTKRTKTENRNNIVTKSVRLQKWSTFKKK